MFFNLLTLIVAQDVWDATNGAYNNMLIQQKNETNAAFLNGIRIFSILLTSCACLLAILSLVARDLSNSDDHNNAVKPSNAGINNRLSAIKGEAISYTIFKNKRQSTWLGIAVSKHRWHDRAFKTNI
jgi:hypothetical protein